MYKSTFSINNLINKLLQNIFLCNMYLTSHIYTPANFSSLFWLVCILLFYECIYVFYCFYEFLMYFIVVHSNVLYCFMISTVWGVHLDPFSYWMNYCINKLFFLRGFYFCEFRESDPCKNFHFNLGNSVKLGHKVWHFSITQY